MRTMNPEQIAACTGGVWRNPGTAAASVNAVRTDARTVSPGCLFVSLTPDRPDEIALAFHNGATGCLCTRAPDVLCPDRFCIEVPDPIAALGTLAAVCRRDWAIPFVQITGSVGKTTAKELIASVLGKHCRVHKTPEEADNPIDIPLELLNLPDGCQAVVTETGMHDFGEIDYLGSLIQPALAVITNIGDAHIDVLGSRENILKAKCEIFHHLRPDGLVILNGDDPLLGALRPDFRTVYCGYTSQCQARIVDVVDHSVRGIVCTVRTARDEYVLTVPSPGTHMAWPAAMAVAAGEELGVGRDEIIRGIAAYTPAGSRMRVLKLCEGRILLDDCYNANPQSVTAALEVLSRTECEKRIAVLGDMGDLGVYARKAHYNVGALTAMLGIDSVIAIGEQAAGIAEGAEQNGGEACHYADKVDAVAELVRQFEPGSTMLIKASRTMEFGTLVEKMKQIYGSENDV